MSLNFYKTLGSIWFTTTNKTHLIASEKDLVEKKGMEKLFGKTIFRSIFYEVLVFYLPLQLVKSSLFLLMIRVSLWLHL